MRQATFTSGEAVEWEYFMPVMSRRQEVRLESEKDTKASLEAEGGN